MFKEFCKLAKLLAGGFKHFFIFTPRKMISSFDEHMFQLGGKKPPKQNRCNFMLHVSIAGTTKIHRRWSSRRCAKNWLRCILASLQKWGGGG